MLLHGDCLELMPTIADQSIDLILTDAPYGMDYQSSARNERFSKIAGDKSPEVFLQALPDMVRILKPDRHAYFFCSWHHIDIFKQAIQQHLTIKNVLVWAKNNHGAGDLKGAYSPKHEFIIFAHKGRRELRGKRLPDVLLADKVSGSKMVHPTEKPVPLLETFINASTDIGETVFDPFIGSGTTAIGAIRTRREWIGIERDSNYVDIARSRIQAESLARQEALPTPLNT